MASVWPLDNVRLADDLNTSTTAEVSCPAIVSRIDIVMSRDAISKATRSRSDANFSGDGPYLIAWSPSKTVGQPGAALLVWNLSNVTTTAEATRQFAAWAMEIERNPALWRNGWNRDELRTVLRSWADRWGSEILQAIGLQ